MMVDSTPNRDDLVYSMLAWAFPLGGPIPSLVVMWLYRADRLNIAWHSAINAFGCWVIMMGTFLAVGYVSFLADGPAWLPIVFVFYFVAPAVACVSLYRRLRRKEADPKNG